MKAAELAPDLTTCSSKCHANGEDMSRFRVQRCTRQVWGRQQGVPSHRHIGIQPLYSEVKVAAWAVTPEGVDGFQFDASAKSGTEASSFEIPRYFPVRWQHDSLLSNQEASFQTMKFIRLILVLNYLKSTGTMNAFAFSPYRMNLNRYGWSFHVCDRYNSATNACGRRIHGLPRCSSLFMFVYAAEISSDHRAPAFLSWRKSSRHNHDVTLGL